MEREAELAALREALARGENLVAYDRGRAITDDLPDDVEARWLAALALARAGAEVRAAEELEAAWLASSTHEPLPVELAEDMGALGARLAKDAALRMSGPRRRSMARDAAARYEAVYQRFNRPYACINAATMYLLAGDDARAAQLARTSQRLTAEQSPVRAEEQYWHAATEAEAALVLGDAERAREALVRADRLLPGNYAARASTRRQLALVCERVHVDRALLGALRVPSVAHFCGHLMAAEGQRGRLLPDDVPRVRAELEAHLEAGNVGFAYGSPAAGGDLLAAEAVLKRGAELHLFLPYGVDEFLTTSVAGAGDEWVRRFHDCLDGAASVTVVDEGPYLGDQVLFEYCARIAMGRALIRGNFLTADVDQLAVWDGLPSDVPGSTGSAVKLWRRRGGATHVVGVDPPREKRAPSPEPAVHRVVYAMLFADLKGFSRLHDGLMRVFADVVLAPIAEVLARYDPDILKRQTWGDGLHVVFRGVVPAARCALDLQRCMETIDWSGAGFPEPLGLRVGAHVGPVLEVRDPICDARDYMGTHIVRTARIEPRTPEGDVYVTDPFAALLTLEGEQSLSCEYVGHIPTAKGYGTFPMYVLKERR